MAFVGPNTQFKLTLRAFRQSLFAVGFTFVQVYQRTIGYKLRKNLFTFTITGLSTATTVGSQYTSNGNTFTVQTTAPVSATTIMMSCETGNPAAASSTLTLVANSSGATGTAQSTISYSAFTTTPAFLGPYNQLEEPVTVQSQL